MGEKRESQNCLPHCQGHIKGRSRKREREGERGENEGSCEGGWKDGRAREGGREECHHGSRMQFATVTQHKVSLPPPPRESHDSAASLERSCKRLFYGGSERTTLKPAEADTPPHTDSCLPPSSPKTHTRTHAHSHTPPSEDQSENRSGCSKPAALSP